MRTLKNLLILALTVLIFLKQERINNLKQQLAQKALVDTIAIPSIVNVSTSDPAWSVCWSNTVSHPIGLVHSYEKKDGSHANELWTIVEPK